MTIQRTMKMLSACLLSAGLLWSCADKSAFKLSGTLPDGAFEGDTLYITSFTMETLQNGPKAWDSAVVKNGKFEFSSKADSLPELCMVYPKNPYKRPVVACNVVREAGKVELTFTVKDGDLVGKVSGTKLNDALQKVMDAEAANPASLEERKAFVKETIATPVGELYFLTLLEHLSPDQVQEFLKNARPQFLSNPLVKEHVAMFSEDYKDVSATDTNGKEVSLSSIVSENEYVLVDFWASWCNPCLKEIPHLSSAYEKYKSKGFTIVSISVDENDSDWRNALAKHKMEWTQLRDVSQKASEAYGVSAIPFTLLVSKDGKIVARNLRGDELSNKLEELLK